MRRPLDWEREGRDWPLREASRFVPAGGPEWHVQELGGGPLVLLLHGTGASTHSWRDVSPRLAADFTVISVDLPGHGFTAGRSSGGLTLPGMAAAVSDLLVALERRPALVVAHSAGVAIAARMALDGGHDAPIFGFAPALRPFPGLVAPLFAGIAQLLLVNPFAPRLFARMARVEGETGRFLVRSTGSRLTPDGIALYERLFASPAHCGGALEMMARWDGLADVARHLPDLPVPLGLAHGDADRAIPLAAARDAATAAGTACELLPGLGHLAHEERPDLAADLVRRFFAVHAKAG